MTSHNFNISYVHPRCRRLDKLLWLAVHGTRDTVYLFWRPIVLPYYMVTLQIIHSRRSSSIVSFFLVDEFVFSEILEL